jgi:hypothetical protein
MINVFRYTGLILLVLLCPQIGRAQFQKAWTLPQHQLQLQTGIVNNTHYLGLIDPFPNSYYVGGTYYYNFSSHWYASADYQYTQGTFKMGARRYEVMGTEIKTFYDYPTLENPWTMPIVRFNQNRGATENDIRNSEYIKLTSSEGQYSRTHYNLNGGYMRVMPRNVLRIGVGVSYFRLKSRDILSGIFDYTSTSSNYVADLQYLRVLDVSDVAFNARIAYDFFITHNLSIGLQLNALFEKNGLNSHARHAGITFGYALTKKSVKPSV